MNARLQPTPPGEHGRRVFRAEHVGSFLRPKPLLEAREKFKAGEISAADLRAVENEAILQVVRFQEDLGLRSITDGEFRRTYFHVDFLTQLQGVEVKGGLTVKFHNVHGDLDFAPPVLHVTDKVRHVRDIERRNFEFLRSITRGTPKVTIPSPTMLHFRGGRAGISETAYPDLEEFFADVAAAYQAEIASLAEAGCTYLQLDDTNLAYLCDERQREAARRRGQDPDELPRLYARLINAAIARRPPQMVVGIHLCRGNFKSSWAAEGGYEPVAEVLFNELEVDAYFLEYDDARSGDFAPLRHVPRGKQVVLGLISTKLGQLEDKAEVLRRLEEAGRYLPLEQASISPQCGFASTVEGNAIDMEAQAAKLRLVVEIAREVWGEA
jgi:5-methyltetrahydropteroyltriglutamate--homocysteine methyltransferase